MLRLQNHLLCAIRTASHAPTSPLHRFHLSTAAASPWPVRCRGLPRHHVRHRTSASAPGLQVHPPPQVAHQPDAVRAFLADAGIAKADIASAIAWDPRFFCSSVDKTLAPRVAQLRDMGLSPPQIARLVATIPGIFHSPYRIARLEFYISLMGSYDNAEAALKSNFYLLESNIENVVKPNLAFLQQCGLSACDIAKLFNCTGKLLTSNLEHLKKMVARAEELGVRRSSGMFTTALIAICNFTPEKISAKMESLEKALGGYPEAKMAVCKLPSILNLSEAMLAHRVEFLRMEFGLEPSYMARRPAILLYSLEMRLIARHYVIQILKAKGLVN